MVLVRPNESGGPLFYPEISVNAKSNLKKAGLFPKKQGWFSNEISSKIDLIILGMHAKKNNVELKKAQSIGLKIKSYPEFISSISSNKTRVVVAGSHGKSSISAMILHVMNYNNINIDYIIGAPIQGSKETISLTDKNDFILMIFILFQIAEILTKYKSVYILHCFGGFRLLFWP